jgi:hypothetical protein
MTNDQEQEKLIDDMTKAVKANGDLSAWKNNRTLFQFLNLLASLNSVPKTTTPTFDFSRVRGQILDRIGLPKTTPVKGSRWFGSFGVWAGAAGSLVIIISLTMATAVAALQSVPGQTIYPLKKVVENIQLRFTPDSQKPALQLQFADNRLDEIQTVLDKQKSGQITAQEAQKIVSATVQDLQKTTAAAASTKQPKADVANKLADITAKLQTASIHTDGEVKIEIEKAVQSTQISHQANKNIENAGIKVEDKPISISNTVTASGKVTLVSDSSITVGTAKFLLTKDTQYVGIAIKDLKADQVVDIQGEIRDNKSYAVTVTLILNPQIKGAEIEVKNPTDPPVTDTKTDTPLAP